MSYPQSTGLPRRPFAGTATRPYRPAYSNPDLLPGILRVLRSGCRWRDLDRSGSPSGVTHWRRLRYWHKWKGYRQVWRALLNLLVQSKRLDRSLVSLDGTLIPSQEFAEQTGYSGKHRTVGTKLSLLVDRRGTPLAVSVAPGNYHDGALGFLTLANIFKPLPILHDILPDAAKTAEPTFWPTRATTVSGSGALCSSVETRPGRTDAASRHHPRGGPAPQPQ